MTSSHGRRIQSRRALAIMAWASLVVVAWLLWYGQHNRIVRIQAWEPAALLLSAYSAFLAIFGWLLFSPGRKSAEESPGLFFAGMLTLLPPCFIAYHLMPVGSPLKPWLTIGVFIFGIIAIMSPLPDEVFAVPRDRRTYLQPLTDAYLTEIDVEEPQIHFDNLPRRTEFRLTQSANDDFPAAAEARDPWADPFLGTGRQMSRIGVSQSRRSDDAAHSERRRLKDPANASALGVLVPGAVRETQPAFGNLTPRNAGRPVADPLAAGGSPNPSTAVPPYVVPVPRPQESPRPADIRRQESTSEGRTHETPVVVALPAIAPSIPISAPASRRPLTEPSGRTTAPVGFQTPVPALKPIPSPPPLPVMFPSMTTPATGPASLGIPPVASPTLPRSPASEVRPAIPPARDVAFGTAAGTMASSLAVNPSMPDLMKVINPVEQSPTGRKAESVAAELVRPILPTSEFSAAKTSTRTPEMSLQELDRQLREQEASDADAIEETMMASAQMSTSADSASDSGVTRSIQQTSGDVTLERLRDEHGGEMIEGTIKVFFEVGQKRAHLHVPFSPPLAGLPEVECEPTGDDPIRLKVAVRQPYGVRIEARRAEAAEALRTEISFAAVYTPTARRS